MKRLLLFVVTCIGMVSLSHHVEAQTQMYIVKEGMVTTYEGVPDYITFSESEQPELDTKPPAEGYKGTVAAAADLGLPSGTLWASHNIGASSASEYGRLLRLPCPRCASRLRIDS